MTPAKWLINSFRNLIVLILIVSAIALAFELFFIFKNEQNNFKYIKTLALDETEEATQNLGLYFGDKIRLVEELEENISTGKVSKYKTLEYLQNEFELNSDLAGLCIAYEPYQYRKNIQFYIPYFTREDGEINIDMDEEDYKADIPENQWYNKPMTDVPSWIDPYYEASTDVLMTSYSLPFYRNADERESKANPLGVIDIDISLESVKDIVTSIELGKTGYGYILSSQGRFLSHPDRDFVRKRVSFFNLAEKEQNKYLQPLADELKKSDKEKSGFLSIYNKQTNETSWVAFRSIPNTDWTLVTTFPEDEVKLDVKDVRRRYILAIITALLFVTALFALIFKVYRFDEVEWEFTILVSVMVSVAMVFIWFTATKFSSDQLKDSVKIVNKGGLNQFLSTQTKQALEKRTKPPIFVTTGVFIQSLDFLEANDIFMTGYLWQKYPKHFDSEIEKGAVFPEAVEISMNESYTRYDKDSTETIGWYFEVTLRQDFDYSKYPFDNKNISIRLWPKDFYQNIILIPDIDAYKFVNPSALPGLDKNIVLSEWDIKNSYFSFVKHNYDTNFGVSTYTGKNDFWEYYYTITAERNIVSPFISILLPFFVIITLLFALLLIMPENDREAFLTSAAGLLFTILLAHFSLRENLNLKEIVYFEYFYFVLYFMIIILIINTFLYFAEKSYKIIDYEKNTFTKLFYWPIVMGILLIITIFTYF